MSTDIFYCNENCALYLSSAARSQNRLKKPKQWLLASTVVTIPRVLSRVNSGSGANWARRGAFTLKAWSIFCFHEFVQTTFDLCELLVSTILCSKEIQRLTMHASKSTSFHLFWIFSAHFIWSCSYWKRQWKIIPYFLSECYTGVYKLLSFSSRSTVFQKEFSIFSYWTC